MTREGAFSLIRKRTPGVTASGFSRPSASFGISSCVMRVAATGASGPHHGVLAPHRLHQVGVLLYRRFQVSKNNALLGQFGGQLGAGLLALGQQRQQPAEFLRPRVVPVGERLAVVGDSIAEQAGDDAHVIDCRGLVLAPAIVDLGVEEVEAALSQGAIVLVDVREPYETAQGMIPGSVAGSTPWPRLNTCPLAPASTARSGRRPVTPASARSAPSRRRGWRPCGPR